MAPPDRVHVDLELDVNAEPIRGAVRVGSAPAREFSGWIALISALESLRAEGQS